MRPPRLEKRLFWSVLTGAIVALPVLIFTPGCETTKQEQIKRFNDDGVFLFRKGDYQGARQDFEEALQINPEDANLLYNIGQCWGRQGDWPQAEKYYRMCLEKVSKHVDARHALDELLYRTGRRDEAARLIAGWLAEEPRQADALAEEGWRLRQDRNFPLAQTRLQEALAIDSHNRRALTELGILFEEMAMPGHALALYERILADDPNNSDIRERINHLRQTKVEPAKLRI